jgi:glycosyltransferase involved in cell wall biosynthesis
MGRKFEIKVAGSGKDFQHISSMVERFGLQKEVQLLGWIDHQRLSDVFANADVGLVPHYVCSHWNNTIPNKIFDYMNAGIPVVVSDAIPVRRIVEETGCGLWYPDTDGAALAQRLVQLEDGAVRERYGKNGYQAVVARYNWQQDSRVLLDSVASLTSHKVA